MKVDTMRAIDHWVGVPLCFLLTRVQRLVSPSRPPFGQSPQRVLFIELSEMGSAVLADPAMRKARDGLGLELYFVIFARNAGSLGFLNTVHDDHIYRLRDDGLWGLAVDSLKFLLWTRRHKIDAVVDLELFSRFTALLTGLSGAAWRVGFYRFHNEGLYRGELLTHRVAYNPHQHIAKNFIALINALASRHDEVPFSKVAIPDSEISLAHAVVSEADKNQQHNRIASRYPRYDRRFHRVVLLNANASELLPQRRWPLANFAHLAGDILDQWPDALILMTGADSEAMDADTVLALAGRPDRLVSFTGAVALRELPALYAIATVMVTNDSGPGHFSAVTTLPTVVLFGPETPTLYGSLGNTTALTANLACSPCVSASNHRKTPCSDPVCMRAITPAQVLTAVSRYLSPVSP